jgi:hypothetical protein
MMLSLYNWLGLTRAGGIGVCGLGDGAYVLIGLVNYNVSSSIDARQRLH